MKLSKTLSFIAIAFASMILVGCGGSWGGSINVSGSEQGVSFEGQVTYTFSFKSLGLPAPRTGGTFDAALVSVDFSSSSVDVTSTTGVATVILTLNDNTSVSQNFTWVRQGQEIVFQSPSSVNSWLASYWEDISSVSATITGKSESYAGTNTLTGEPSYGGVEQTSFSTTWSGGAGGGWCDPVTRICYDPL